MQDITANYLFMGGVNDFMQSVEWPNHDHSEQKSKFISTSNFVVASDSATLSSLTPAKLVVEKLIIDKIVVDTEALANALYARTTSSVSVKPAQPIITNEAAFACSESIISLVVAIIFATVARSRKETQATQNISSQIESNSLPSAEQP